MCVSSILKPPPPPAKERHFHECLFIESINFQVSITRRPKCTGCYIQYKCIDVKTVYLLIALCITQ